jgi:hypothetical protein
VYYELGHGCFVIELAVCVELCGVRRELCADGCELKIAAGLHNACVSRRLMALLGLSLSA